MAGSPQGQPVKPVAPPAPVNALIKRWVALRMYFMGPGRLYHTHRLARRRKPHAAHSRWMNTRSAGRRFARTWTTTEQALGRAWFRRSGRAPSPAGQRRVASRHTRPLLEHPEPPHDRDDCRDAGASGAARRRATFKDTLKDGRVDPDLELEYPAAVPASAGGTDVVYFPRRRGPVRARPPASVSRRRMRQSPPKPAAGDAARVFRRRGGRGVGSLGPRGLLSS